MNIPVIKIDDSKGIKLSDDIIKKYNIGNEVELILENDQLVIRSKKEPRKGWNEKFKKMHENKDDELLVDDIFDEEKFLVY